MGEVANAERGVGGLAEGQGGDCQRKDRTDPVYANGSGSLRVGCWSLWLWRGAMCIYLDCRVDQMLFARSVATPLGTLGNSNSVRLYLSLSRNTLEWKKENGTPGRGN